jgi:2-keto-4-pentenoate hydratase/2-oxohepta-3-ene-1,7-dioic acid hydratase in catechol pathway
MKFLRAGNAGAERPGVMLPDGSIRDISSIVPDITRDTIGTLRQKVEQIDLEALPIIPAGTRLAAPVADVRHFIGVGLNYADHAAEAGMAVPKEPILFNKAPSCIVGPNDDIVYPEGGTKLDWEVELGIVIGKTCDRVTEEDAISAIAGYTICNDISERAFQLERGGSWMKGKSCPTFGPIGPWLVTPDELPAIDDLGMWLDVNGERMQSGSTRTMIFGVPFLVSYISQFMTLEPGDVIATGTPPGVGMAQKPPRYLSPGDVVSLGISGLGEQRQRVKKALR